MANGMPTSTFDKVLDAANRFGIAAVIAGVLLWYMLTKWDTILVRQDATLTALEHLMEEGRATQLESRQMQQDMRAFQVETGHKVDSWIARGCAPTPPP